jgi:uncharacterized protein (DUF1786 family)
MTIGEKQLFELLDQYARSRHACFVSEMFLNKSQTEYVVCFRPANISPDSSNRDKYKYLRFDALIAKTGNLPMNLTSSIKQKLDEALSNLNAS